MSRRDAGPVLLEHTAIPTESFEVGDWTPDGVSVH